MIAPRHWPLCGKLTGDRWISRTNASNAENVSISWRHHVFARPQPSDDSHPNFIKCRVSIRACVRPFQQLSLDIIQQHKAKKNYYYRICSKVGTNEFSWNSDGPLLLVDRSSASTMMVKYETSTWWFMGSCNDNSGHQIFIIRLFITKYTTYLEGHLLIFMLVWT